MKWRVPLYKMTWDNADVRSVTDVIRRGSYWAVGPEILDLEEETQKVIGTRYAVSFNSGTSALQSALLAYDVCDKEVIVPSFTFISTANAVVLAGGKPVFAETEPETFGLDVESVKNKITKNTKAIIPIHYGGCGCKDILELKKLSEDNNLILIEDAAESFGATVNGKQVGSFGDAGMFSLCQTKTITCGEGGIVTTNDKEINVVMKLLRSHGRLEKKGDYFTDIGMPDYVTLGYNFRLPSMNAALALSQLKRLNNYIELRRKIALIYDDYLGRISQIRTPIEPKGFNHTYQMYTLLFKDEDTRDNVQRFLTNRGIMSKIYFEPVHLTTYYQQEYGYQEGDLPQTEELSKRVLTIPLYPSLSLRNIQYIVNSIKGYFNGIN